MNLVLGKEHSIRFSALIRLRAYEAISKASPAFKAQAVWNPNTWKDPAMAALEAQLRTNQVLSLYLWNGANAFEEEGLDIFLGHEAESTVMLKTR